MNDEEYLTEHWLFKTKSLGEKQMNKEEEMSLFRRDILPKYEKILEDEKNIKKDKLGVTVKQCRICGEYKRLSAFYKNPLKSFGRFDECKKCLKKIRETKK